MSDWTRLADDASEVAFGLGPRLHFLRPEHDRCIAYVEQHNSTGPGRTVVAIAVGSNHAEACRMLIQMCYRQDHRPTTQEVAVVLGVSDGRVRQLVQAGRLVPVELGASGNAARFAAQDVFEMLQPEAVAP